MTENRVKDGNYYVVQSFMVKDLKLKGLEKDVYAIIYGFSQAENQTFTGSLQYLADWTNSTKQGILKTLNSLVERNLICKKENIINGVKFVEYYSTQFNTPIKESLMGIKESLTNNINNNIFNNIDINNIRQTRFIKPTLEEVKAYCEERKNNVDANKFIDFYTSKGWKVGNQPMKDWKACVRTWENKDKKVYQKEQPKAEFMQHDFSNFDFSSLIDDLKNVEF